MWRPFSLSPSGATADRVRNPVLPNEKGAPSGARS